MNLTELIGHNSALLTRSERRVAEMVLQQPQLVAFGTVADLAQAANAGVATVARLSSKLGFSGFSALQAALQQEMADWLRPAAVRINEGSNNTLAQHVQVETNNVHQTLGRIEENTLFAVSALLSRLDKPITMLTGNASSGVAQQFVEDLSALRPLVQYLSGNPVQVGRSISLFQPQDILIVLDLRRYDAWLIEAVQMAHDRGACIIVLTDSVLSPLAQFAQETLLITAVGSGPFDSHVGTLALFNVIVSSVAQQLKSTARERLAQTELAWHGSKLLVDRS